MKLNKFEEFINESVIVNLLLEGSLAATGEFIDRLDTIKSKSDVAKGLHKGFKNAYYVYSDLDQNYIDVTDQEDMVSFISDKKADGEEDPYTSRKRGTIKIGRLVNALISNNDARPYFFGDVKPSAKDIEEFVNLYKASKVEKTNQFKIVDGSEIAYWYDEKNYWSKSAGQLGNSCMKDVDSDYFDIYVKNPRVCKLVIYVNQKNELLGRALLWKLDKTPLKGTKWFMDRIYTNRDSDINRFKDFANQEGFLYKFKNNFDGNEGLMFYHKGQPVFGEATVKLNKSDFNEFPFLDTLFFFDRKEGTLSNVGSKKAVILNDTSGEDSGYCGRCGGKGKVEEYDYDAGKDYKIKCPECTGLVEHTRENLLNSYPAFKDYLPK